MLWHTFCRGNQNDGERDGENFIFIIIPVVMKLAGYKKFTKEKIRAEGAASDDCFPAQL